MIGNCFAPRCSLLLSLTTAFGAAANAQTLVLVGGNVYPSPDAAPLADAVVVTSNGVITAIGSRSDVQIPTDARVIDCTGKTVVAGFWNSHVHFTEAVWRNAASAPAAALEAHMQEMLTRWGFTTVWDLGSDPDDSLPLRRRVNAGEVPGPNIFLAGNIFPKGGHPVYVPTRGAVPEVATPDEAAKMARDYLGMGHDGIKLFTGAFMGDKPVVNMDAAIAKAAVDVAHAQGKPVFAHPQNTAGVETVIAAGVDVMAHTVPGRHRAITPEQLARFKSQGIALMPTLSLFTTVVLRPDGDGPPGRGDRQPAQADFRTTAASFCLGPTSASPSSMTPRSNTNSCTGRFRRAQVLASLTTNPARYFKAAKKGRVEKGFDADLVVLDGDPMTDVRNLAKVAYTIRAGKVIYQKP